jgi:hypothetical protein
MNQFGFVSEEALEAAEEEAFALEHFGLSPIIQNRIESPSLSTFRGWQESLKQGGIRIYHAC